MWTMERTTTLFVLWLLLGTTTAQNDRPKQEAYGKVFVLTDESEINGKKYFNTLVGTLDNPEETCVIDCRVCETDTPAADDCNSPWEVTVTANDDQANIEWTGVDREGADVHFVVTPKKCAKFGNGNVDFDVRNVKVKLVCLNTAYNVSVNLVCKEITVNSDSFVVWTPPDVPQNVLLVNSTSSSIEISWTSPVGPVQWYRVKVNETVYDNITNTYFEAIQLKTYTTYTFQVAARNSFHLGKWSKEILLTTEKKPSSEPRYLQKLNATSTSITVQWEKPEFFTEPILLYTVEWKNLDSAMPESGNSTQLFYHIEGLMPFTKYQIVVYAVTKSGQGNSSKIVEMSGIGLPSIPRNLTKIGSSNRSIEIEWIQPEHMNGPKVIYEVEWKNLKDEEVQNDTTENMNYSITSLQPFTKYSIRVRATTTAGSGLWSDPMVVRTDIGVPSVPRNSKIKNEKNTSLEVCWIEPEPNVGPITYFIELSRTNSSFKEVGQTVKICFLVAGLDPYTEYFIRITAVTAAGRSKPTQSLKARTAVGIPSVPRNAKIKNEKNTSLEVCWTEPEPHVGPITYFIEQSRTNSNFKEVGQTDKVCFVIEGLDPYTEYFIRITAVTAAGRSKPTQSLKSRTAVGNGYTYLTLDLNQEYFEPEDRTVTIKLIAPSIPRNLKAVKMEKTSIKMCWEEPEPNVGPIILYVVETSKDNVFKSIDTTNSTCFTIEHLSPYTVYFIRIRAVTEADEGKPTEVVKTRTAVGIPSIPRNLTKIGSSNRSIEIEWIQPEHMNGPKVIYDVEWRNLKDEEVQNDTTENMNYSITSLQPFTKYSIRVRATTTAGSGVWCNPMVVRTDIGVPTVPRNAEIKNVKNTSLEACWTEPEPDVGPITYFIELSKTDTNFKNVGQTVEICFLVEGLDPYTEYLIRISAATEAGRGEPTQSLKARTAVGTPSVPRNLKAVKMEMTSIQMCWEEPEPHVGPIILYVVETSKDNVFKSIDTTNSTCFTIEHLSPYTVYFIRIRAVTEADEGKPTEAVKTRTAVGIPSIPRNLTKIGSSNRSIEIEWIQPEHMNGPKVIYDVEWRNLKDEEVQNDTTENMNYSITSLQPFTKYSIRVRATTTAGSGVWCNPMVVRTDIGVPSEPTGLKTTIITNTSIALTWQDPEPIVGNIELYSIRWWEKMYSGTIKDDYSCNASYLISGLDVYSNYSIQVKASTEVGFGKWSKIYEVRTLSGVPMPPRNVVAVNVKTRIIELKWDEPNPFKGPVLSYTVRWKHIASNQIRMGRNVRSKYTIEDLDPYSFYAIEVSAETSAGNGSWSNLLKIQTAIGLPTVPRSISHRNKTAWSIELTWKSPEPANGPIVKYRVDWGVLKGEVSSNETDGTSFEESGLVPYTNYFFQVSALTEAGWGPSSAPYVLQTDIAEPSVPINLTMDSVTYGSIAVGWSKPLHSNGPLLEYQVRWRKTADDVEKSELQNGTYFKIPDLYPYTNYSIQVAARTHAGRGPWTEVLVSQTSIAVPAKAHVASVRVESSRSLAVMWMTPTVYPGPTKYALKVWRRPGQCEDPGVAHKVSEMEGSKGLEEWSIMRTETVVDLTPHSLYFMRVTLQTEAGRSESADSSDFWTFPDVPEAPTQVQADCKKSSTETILRWKPPHRPNGKILQYLVSYGIESSEWYERIVTVTSECKEHQIKIENLKPEKKYWISVRAKVQNVSDNGKSATLDGYCILPAGVPPMGNVGNVQAQGSGPYRLQLEWSRDAFSDDMGALVNYAVIIGTSEAVGNATRGRDSELHPTWHNFSSGLSDFYQTTPLEWNPFNKDKEDPLNCEEVIEEGTKRPSKLRCFVGASSCSTMEPYCNGPLRPDTKYGLKLRAFTRGGFSETQPLFASTDPVPRSSIVEVVVSSIIVLLLIGAAIVSVFILKRKGKLQYMREAILSRFGKRSTPPTSPLEPVLQLETRHPVYSLTIHNFAEHVRILMSDSHLRFSQEFEALKCNSPKFPCFAAEMEENRTKNRWMNIFPFDHSRVKLLPLGDDPASDFINANYIPGYSSHREYIASQGPLASTVDDFWRMIWEQSVTMIVMLTQCVERGRNKCERYWPQSGETKHYGDVQVHCISDSMLSCFSIHMLHLRLGCQERKVKQMHFTHWPDFGCPESPGDLINFVRAVRDHLPRVHPGPILVHCSAGVGRTGTFIAVDRLYQQLPYTENVDIYGTVMELRQHRINMVQTEDQYIYIHLCIRQLINEMNQPPENECEEAIYSNVCIENDTGL